MNTRAPDSTLVDLVVEATDAFASSQADLASEIGVQPLAVTTWRRGRSRPTAEHLRKMARALAERGERLHHLSLELEARATLQEQVSGVKRPDSSRRFARVLASRIVAAGEGRVRRVVFFGSRARGAPRSSASDWDFVVVMGDGRMDQETEERRLKAAAVAGEGDEVFVDLWVTTESEWESSRRLPGHPLRTANEEGVVLYAAG